MGPESIQFGSGGVGAVGVRGRHGERQRLEHSDCGDVRRGTVMQAWVVPRGTIPDPEVAPTSHLGVLDSRES